MPACRLNQAVRFASFFRQSPRASTWSGCPHRRSSGPYPRRSGNPVVRRRRRQPAPDRRHEFQDSDHDARPGGGVRVNRRVPRLAVTGPPRVAHLFGAATLGAVRPGRGEADGVSLFENFGSPRGTIKWKVGADRAAGPNRLLYKQVILAAPRVGPSGRSRKLRLDRESGLEPPPPRPSAAQEQRLELAERLLLRRHRARPDRLVVHDHVDVRIVVAVVDQGV